MDCLALTSLTKTQQREFAKCLANGTRQTTDYGKFFCQKPLKKQIEIAKAIMVNSARRMNGFSTDGTFAANLTLFIAKHESVYEPEPEPELEQPVYEYRAAKVVYEPPKTTRRIITASTAEDEDEMLRSAITASLASYEDEKQRLRSRATVSRVSSVSTVSSHGHSASRVSSVSTVSSHGHSASSRGFEVLDLTAEDTDDEEVVSQPVVPVARRTRAAAAAALVGVAAPAPAPAPARAMAPVGFLSPTGGALHTKRDCQHLRNCGEVQVVYSRGTLRLCKTCDRK